MEEIKEAESLAAELNDPKTGEGNPDYKGGWGEGDDDGWDGSGEDDDIMAERPDWD